MLLRKGDSASTPRGEASGLPKPAYTLHTPIRTDRNFLAPTLAYTIPPPPIARYLLLRSSLLLLIDALDLALYSLRQSTIDLTLPL